MQSNQSDINQRHAIYRYRFKRKGFNHFPGYEEISTTCPSDRMASPIRKRRIRSKM